MKGTIYVLEDDSSIAGLIKFSLEREQLTCRAFGSIQEFRNGLKEKSPDVALLDIMLPDGSGLEVLKFVKERYPSVCCIMLSALGQEGDKVTGLNLGADDYIAKPFGVMELVARVHAALRRQAGSNVIKIGDLELEQRHDERDAARTPARTQQKGIRAFEILYAQRRHRSFARRPAHRDMGIRRYGNEDAR